MSFAICGRILTRSFLRKRKDVCHAEVDSSRLERTYTLFDLLCVGIGTIRWITGNYAYSGWEVFDVAVS